MYFVSSISKSLVTSSPVSSAIVQYLPRKLFPLVEFSSLGIWFIGIAPKCVTPGELNLFFSKILSKSFLNLDISNYYERLETSDAASAIKKNKKEIILKI